MLFLYCKNAIIWLYYCFLVVRYLIGNKAKAETLSGEIEWGNQ